MSFIHHYNIESKPLPPKPTAYVLGLVGFALLIFTGFLVNSTNELEKDGIRVQGKVIKLERNEGSHFPVYKFTDIKGRELTVRSSSSSKSYFVGDSIPILYDAKNPLEAKVDEPLMLYIFPLITGFVGILFLSGGLLVFKVLPFFEKVYEKQKANQEK